MQEISDQVSAIMRGLEREATAKPSFPKQEALAQWNAETAAIEAEAKAAFGALISGALANLASIADSQRRIADALEHGKRSVPLFDAKRAPSMPRIDG